MAKNTNIPAQYHKGALEKHSFPIRYTKTQNIQNLQSCRALHINPMPKTLSDLNLGPMALSSSEA